MNSEHTLFHKGTVYSALWAEISEPNVDVEIEVENAACLKEYL